MRRAWDAQIIARFPRGWGSDPPSAAQRRAFRAICENICSPARACHSLKRFPTETTGRRSRTSVPYPWPRARDRTIPAEVATIAVTATRVRWLTPCRFPRMAADGGRLIHPANVGRDRSDLGRIGLDPSATPHSPTTQNIDRPFWIQSSADDGGKPTDTAVPPKLPVWTGTGDLAPIGDCPPPDIVRILHGLAERLSA